MSVEFRKKLQRDIIPLPVHYFVCQQQKARLRKTDLDESLQEQQYFADANEAESWMKEKEPLVANTDYGKDQDSAQVRAQLK